ncbi:hypothetical protein HDU96_008879 [Phlyctochytrium bullatum]|nr:hypothetical protein HDU96_008879 [Phlyctochytrium bullatum]
MTRVTLKRKRQHLDATEGWAVKALPTKSQLEQSSNQGRSDGDRPTEVEKPKETSENKNKGEQSTDGPKKKRNRHKSKNDIVKPENTDTVEKPDKGDQNQGEKPKRHRPIPTAKTLEQRRERRKRLKERSTICFHCREKGHSIKNCPKQQQAPVEEEMGEGICYKCGSTEHKSSQCKKKTKPDNPYPFATCFVCKKKGHLAGNCDQNDKGLYPNGGGCRFCGSIRHLAKDCKPSKTEAGVTELGVLDANQGGDDDDVFLALKRMEKEKPKETQQKPGKAAPAKPKKKIVKF